MDTVEMMDRVGVVDLMVRNSKVTVKVDILQGRRTKV
jgi:hypothetical protein